MIKKFMGFGKLDETEESKQMTQEEIDDLIESSKVSLDGWISISDLRPYDNAYVWVWDNVNKRAVKGYGQNHGIYLEGTREAWYNGYKPYCFNKVPTGKIYSNYWKPIKPLHTMVPKDNQKSWEDSRCYEIFMAGNSQLISKDPEVSDYDNKAFRSNVVINCHDLRAFVWDGRSFVKFFDEYEG